MPRHSCSTLMNEAFALQFSLNHVIPDWFVRLARPGRLLDNPILALSGWVGRNRAESGTENPTFGKPEPNGRWSCVLLLIGEWLVLEILQLSRCHRVDVVPLGLTTSGVLYTREEKENGCALSSSLTRETAQISGSTFTYGTNSLGEPPDPFSISHTASFRCRENLSAASQLCPALKSLPM
ncbi:hypothetical protein VTK56DRAFT_8600 [Thermocarpiscus australiensis]